MIPVRGHRKGRSRATPDENRDLHVSGLPTRRAARCPAAKSRASAQTRYPPPSALRTRIGSGSSRSRPHHRPSHSPSASGSPSMPEVQARSRRVLWMSCRAPHQRFTRKRVRFSYRLTMRRRPSPNGLVSQKREDVSQRPKPFRRAARPSKRAGEWPGERDTRGTRARQRSRARPTSRRWPHGGL
jgi:hypothetical protein